MVLYFTSTVVSPPATIYMGKDKFENEDLIKHGWPEDVWFHVDKLSSAHVYLRLQLGETWENIPQELLVDLAQLCKANSIEGNKKNNLTIIYTPWSNLLKQGSMATGQVSFKNHQMVKRVFIKERDNAIVNRLNKTKKEEKRDLYQERKDRDVGIAREQKKLAEAIKRKDREAAANKRAKEKSYTDIFTVNSSAPRKPVSENIFGDSDDDDDDDNSDDEEMTGRYADEMADFL